MIVLKPISRSEKGSNSKLSKFLSMKKLLLKRNMSKNKLVDQFISNPRKTEYHSNLKKCSTVLAITPDAEYRSVNSWFVLVYTHFLLPFLHSFLLQNWTQSSRIKDKNL